MVDLFGVLRKIILNRVNNIIRKTAKKIGCRFINNSITSCVNENTILGNDVSFNGMRIIGHGNVFIGSCFHCGEGCYIISDNHDYDNGREIPYDHSKSLAKETVIEDFVWLGTAVIVLPGAYIEEGAIIQAGSVVVGRIPKGAIAGGHPAKVFKYRDMRHYEQLKLSKNYLENREYPQN